MNHIVSNTNMEHTAMLFFDCLLGETVKQKGKLWKGGSTVNTSFGFLSSSYNNSKSMHVNPYLAPNTMFFTWPGREERRNKRTLPGGMEHSFPWLDRNHHRKEVVNQSPKVDKRWIYSSYTNARIKLWCPSHREGDAVL